MSTKITEISIKTSIVYFEEKSIAETLDFTYNISL